MDPLDRRTAHASPPPCQGMESPHLEVQLDVHVGAFARRLDARP